MIPRTVFRPQSGAPLHRQLYFHLQRAILSGELRGGAQLPSSRALATELGLSRNTVLSAFDQLRAEGYLESVEAKGTFVAGVLPEGLLAARVEGAAEPTTFATPRLSSRAQAQLGAPALDLLPTLFPTLAPTPYSKLRTPFSISTPALDAFPQKLWAQLVSRQARKLSVDDLGYGDPAGYRPLREAVAAHVTLSCQVHCTAEGVVIVSGAQGAFTLVSKLLLNPGDEVWLEDPGYQAARSAFLGAGAEVVPVPVDREGLQVEAGIARAPRARLAYVTPSHQLPLGMTLSVTRRLALLSWAKREDAYILEDDYDSEYRYSGRPLAALQTLDDAGRVIYVGSFSKVLFPALRLGFLVLPPPLVQAAVRVRGSLDVQPPALEQRVLAEFIHEGTTHAICGGCENSTPSGERRCSRYLHLCRSKLTRPRQVFTALAGCREGWTSAK